MYYDARIRERHNCPEPFEFTDTSRLDLCLWGWTKSEVCKREVDTGHDLLSAILVAAVCIHKREGQIRRTTRHLRPPVAKYSEVDGEILERLL